MYKKGIAINADYKKINDGQMVVSVIFSIREEVKCKSS